MENLREVPKKKRHVIKRGYGFEEIAVMLL